MTWEERSELASELFALLTALLEDAAGMAAEGQGRSPAVTRVELATSVGDIGKGDRPRDRCINGGKQLTSLFLLDFGGGRSIAVGVNRSRSRGPAAALTGSPAGLRVVGPQSGAPPET